MYCKNILALKAIYFPKRYGLPILILSNKTVSGYMFIPTLNDTAFHEDIPTTRALPQLLPKLGKM